MSEWSKEDVCKTEGRGFESHYEFKILMSVGCVGGSPKLYRKGSNPFICAKSIKIFLYIFA